jgi:hypothetical protein
MKPRALAMCGMHWGASRPPDRRRDIRERLHREGGLFADLLSDPTFQLVPEGRHAEIDVVQQHDLIGS